MSQDLKTTKVDKIPSLHEWLVVGTSTLVDCVHWADDSPFKCFRRDLDEILTLVLRKGTLQESQAARGLGTVCQHHVGACFGKCPAKVLGVLTCLNLSLDQVPTELFPSTCHVVCIQTLGQCTL